MGFIGVQPASVPLTADDITDGIISASKLGSNAVTTAKINADAVTSAKLPDDVISEEHLDNTAITGFSAITSLADTDKFLVSDASDSNNLKYIENQYLGGGGNLIKITQVNLGSAGNLVVDDCFSSTYDNYLVVMEGLRCTVDSQSLRFRFRTGGSSGSTDSASQHRYASRYFDDDGSVSSNTGVDISYFQITDDSEEAGDWKGFCGTFTFYQPYKATSSRYTGDGSFIRNDKADIVSSHNAGHYDSNVSHTGLDFFYSSGGVAAGSVVIVYGLKE